MTSVRDVIVKKPSSKEEAVCRSWPLWQCEPDTFDWVYTQTETCLLLEGEVTVSDKDSSVTFSAGDMVIFPSGLECTWKVTEAVKKHYNFS